MVCFDKQIELNMTYTYFITLMNAIERLNPFCIVNLA